MLSFPAATISWRLNGVPVAADEVETVADARNPKLHLSEIRISAKRAEQGEVVECIADGESNLCLSVFRSVGSVFLPALLRPNVCHCQLVVYIHIITSCVGSSYSFYFYCLT